MPLSSAGLTEQGIVREALLERFGIPASTLDEWRLLATGSVVWGIQEDPRLTEALDALQVERTALPFLRRVGKFWKPTTVALQVLGRHLRASCVSLEREELTRLVGEGFLRGTREGVSQGYVALKGPDGVVGCGRYLGPRPEDGKPDGVLQSQLPQARWGGLSQSLREER